MQLNGLLLIITPDSSHQNRHVDMVKSWKKVIESLGFTRWRYIKDTHLHYMAFRKTTLEPPSQCSDVSPDMLYIPQDYNEDLEENVFLDDYPRSEEDERRCSELFSELPVLDGDDEDSQEEGDEEEGREEGSEVTEEGSEVTNGEPEWKEYDALSLDC